MKFALKIAFAFTLLLPLASSGQTLPGLADSLFAALKYEEFDSLKPFIPTYRELKTTFDSMKINKGTEDVFLDEKRMQYTLKQSFKTLKTEASILDMPLRKLEKDQIRHMILDHEGKEYSIVEIDCHYKARLATVYFTAIKLNNAWYLGEEFRIEKREAEEIPNYEKIDREAERRREKREAAALAAKEQRERDKTKEEAAKKLDAEKFARDSVKKQKLQLIENQKAAKDSIKKAKADEKASLKAEREAEKLRKKQEKEQKKKDKETMDKPKE